ncbi:MAG: Peptidoglycan-binding lysin domain protein [Anaerocolumna sp.]|jgi:spore germination protein|nr:Peptidoglycan-binding lysin domain protein [Anaerocolumna sp.]
MIIHVVQPGETIQSVSDRYNIPVTRLIQDNGILDPDNLVVGQTIVIVYAEITHEVEMSDTLESIANQYNVSVIQLLQNNPFLSEQESLYIGQTLIIEYETEKIRDIVIGGYVYPYIDEETLRKTLPYLTYITTFNYRVTANGDVIDVDDSRLLELAKSYGVAPMMLMSTLSEHGTSQSNTAYTIINNPEIQDRLIDRVVNILKTKGYYGLNLYLQYITNENITLVEEYINKFSVRLRNEGLRFVLSITPRIFLDRTETSFERIDYSKLSQSVDAILFTSYEWGYSYSPPVSVSPVNIIRDILDYLTSMIPPEKLILGVPIIGYDWQLPYIPGVSIANAITSESAIHLAAETGSTIKYDENTSAPYFFYTDGDEFLHIVWFKDARSIESIVGLVPEYGLQGIIVWNLMYFFTQMWFVINNQYDIIKIPDIT